MNYKIHRMPEVQAQTGVSRSTIYAAIQRGAFVKPIKLGARAVGWPDFEVQALINARIAGKTDTQIKELVCTLELGRQNMGEQYAH